MNYNKHMPESKMSLYSYTTSDGMKFFETKQELNEYIKYNNSNGYVTTVDYLGDAYNSIDVIKETYEDGSYRYITVADNEGYLVLNNKIIKEKQQIMWEYVSGCLRDVYSAFRERGISFTDDTYKKIDERNQKILLKYKIKRLNRF